ncbi:hypothetical protein ACKGJO_09245 [Gracilimonas sp. Q87]|uniref:hypothetical protein n=1 Tax=Gracilimonas sp. Q87 TaxID=3384766 RepID=UPI003983DC62
MKRTKWRKKKKKVKAKTKRQRVSKKHHQLIAVNLKEKMRYFEQHPPDIPGFSVSRMEYLIHLILTRKQVDNDNYCNAWSILNMEYMNNVIPQASKYLHLLREEGIIEWINHSAGRNSRWYRLINEGWTEQVPITDMKIIRRVEKNKSHLARRNSKKHPFLNKAIRKVNIDFEEARQAVDEKYQENIQKGMDAEGAEARRTYALSAIMRIHAEEIYIKTNTTNFRLDSNFTNLPGYLLKYCHIEGQSFIEMDIRNSQPYFAGALFNPTKEVLEVMEDYLPHSDLMSVKPLLSIEAHDVNLYRSLVSSGKFYEYMAQQFQDRGLTEFADRKQLKTYLFKSVFFGNKYTYKFKGKAGEPARVFKEVFPTVNKVFNRIKRKEHNKLAILLQRIESYTMLERVVKEIESKHPDMDMLTKHDSILPVRLLMPNKPGALESVRSIMVDTITTVTGLAPQGRMRKLR